MNILGWVSSKDPEGTRVQLESWLPREHWPHVNLMFVGFGQQLQQERAKLLRRCCLDCSRPADALRLVFRLGAPPTLQCKVCSPRHMGRVRISVPLPLLRLGTLGNRTLCRTRDLAGGCYPSLVVFHGVADMACKTSCLPCCRSRESLWTNFHPSRSPAGDQADSAALGGAEGRPRGGVVRGAENREAAVCRSRC